jgi:hypothetical protein
VPFYRQPYFKNKLHCPTPVPGILEAKHGIVEIRMRSLLEKWKGDKIENIINYIKKHFIFYHHMLPKLSNNEHKN